LLQLFAPRRAGRNERPDSRPIRPQNHPGLSVLVERGRISPSDADRAAAEAAASRQPVPVVLHRMELVSGREWAKLIADQYGIQQADDGDIPSRPVFPEAFAGRFLRANWVLPLAEDEATLWLAMADPGDEATIKAARLATRRDVVPVVAAVEVLEHAFARLFDSGDAAIQRIVKELDDLGNLEDADVEELIDQAKEAPVVRLVNQLLSDALAQAASDIHIEPFGNRLQVRYRIHGRLQEISAPPAALSAAVISRIKILARLDIAERRLPQDGRSQLDLDGRRVDLRVATMPTIHGESIVIRLLDTSAARADIDRLGLSDQARAVLEAQLHAPYGMILVTGPTGSGKTTTLYAALKQLDAKADKIVSIEDPIEYRIDGVTQIQVKPEIGLDFARILRSVVRHDPDTIMVGETRDHATADISVHAALTGHLMLSTLHTNSAAGAIGRLLDMGVEPYLLASVLRLVVGQRLVGELCTACRKSGKASSVEIARLRAAGFDRLAMASFYRPQGCRACNQVGFTGRIGIFEMLAIDDTVRELIRERATSQAIAGHAIGHGMTTMFKDGISKAAEGRTSLAEVIRVTEDF